MSEERLNLADEVDREGEAEEAFEERLEEAVSEAPEELAPDEPRLDEVAEQAEAVETPAAEAQVEPTVSWEHAEEELVQPLPEQEASSAGVAEEGEASEPLVAAGDDDASSGQGSEEEAVAATAEEAQQEAVSEAEAEAEAIPSGPVLSSGPGKEWYIVHTYSGYEAKVKVSLEERVTSLGLKDRIPQILVPSEPVVEIKGGKKRIGDRKFFPGYVLVEMELSDDTWYLIKNTPKVTGFLGSGHHPTPLPTEEVKFIIDQMRGEAEKPKIRVLFERGENVQVVDGPFTNFTGVIEEVDEIRGKLRVMVTIFGRATPVEMEFLQVEKI